MDEGTFTLSARAGYRRGAMVLSWFRRRGRKPEPPLAIYDSLVASLERQALEVRRSAATLLAARGELEADCARYRGERGRLLERLRDAERVSDARAVAVLRADLAACEEGLVASEASLGRASEDARVLVEAGRAVGERVRKLRLERASARTRLLAGTALEVAARQSQQRFEQIVALDEARDEVERASALAALYRQDLHGDR